MSYKLLATERSKDLTYALYCVNIFGSGLNCIKDEFKRQVNTGLRQTVFIMDLEDIEDELNNQSRSAKRFTKDLQEHFNAHLINLILHHIQEFRKDYELQVKKINEELKFDLFQYWQKNIAESRPDISKGKANATTKVAKQAKPGSTKLPEPKKKVKVSCYTTLITKEHNRVGRPLLLSKRKFIKDEPILGKLYIIILGQMNKDFYKDLLSRNQPIEGIINFIPTESSYDIMLGNNKLRNFIMATLETISSSIYILRQEDSIKPIGLFTHELPVISNCLATKYCREIFDQITWSIYDIDMLRQQYENYYFTPFQVTDVEMPASVDLTQLYGVVESLAIQGQFQKSSLPASDADLASVVCYLDSLLKSCSLEEDVVGEGEDEVDGEGEGEDESSSNSLSNNLRNSLSTITKISKYQRLVVAENNKLLLNMLQYTDISKFQSIYLCCLDYDMFEQYVIMPPQINTLISPSDKSEYSETACLILPQYVKYYTNLECSLQRLKELLIEYDEHEVQDIGPGYKMYTFKRNYNVINENEGTFIIPTRLCFRDFTLFQMEEFLKMLKSFELNINSITGIHKTISKVKSSEFDENIFIRPNSIKALLAQKEKSEGSKDKKGELRSNRSRTDRKYSLSKTTLKSEDSITESLDHPLLKGYNLEDTLQEVKYKTSKYCYHNGFVKLYEEKWCFQEMNKQLSLSINNATLFFSRPRHQIKGISNNIRLITDKNNISVRILNTLDECSKMVMNYPNGLSVFYNESYCEQVWYCEPTPRHEKRRIFTQLGAVIVFFTSSDLILIMRYNGEVYRLYQHELVGEEEEQDLSNLGDIEEKSSEFEDIKARGDSLFRKEVTQNDILKKQKVETKKTSKKPAHSHKRLSEESYKSSSVTNSATQYLKSRVNDELQFLNLLCSIYNLTYIHLILTTSQGKRVNLKQQGEIFEGRPCTILEWHDYFANEAYCERNDGVKMIWAQDSFKCFHKDGTLFTTTIEEEVPEVNVDEFESEITESSSHNALLEEMEEDVTPIHSQDLNEYLTQKRRTLEKLTTYIISDSIDEHLPKDNRFKRYKYRSWNMQHPNYAEVYVLNSNRSILSARMDVLGIDDIKMYIDIDEGVELDAEEYECEECMEGEKCMKIMVHVWLGEKLHVITDTEACKICAVMPQSKDGSDILVQKDFLTLDLKYKDYINDVFKSLVDEIASFENFNGQKSEELYFVEKINTDASIRGFEFLPSLPVISEYKYHISNNIIELSAVNTIKDSVICVCEEREKDVNKFPRFKLKHEQKTCYKTKDVLPQLLSANIFMEIPKQLLSLNNVTKFLEPFEDIHYKRLRGKFKNILNFYLEPKQQLLLKLLCSRNHWKKRQWEHERRIFNENQRLGLYYAMNKHKIYPNYWHFTQNYESEVRHIEFFDFMQK